LEQVYEEGDALRPVINPWDWVYPRGQALPKKTSFAAEG